MNSQDTHLYPVIIRAGEQTLKIIEGGSDTFDIVLLPGTWYAYKSTPSTPIALTSPYNSLYDMIIARIALAGLDGDYTLEAGDPTAATGSWSSDCGISLRDLNSGDFAVDWTNSTIDPRIFGFGLAETGLASSSGGLVTGPYCRLGAFIAMHPPTSKTSFTKRHLYASTEDIDRIDAYQMSYGSSRVRSWRYELIPAGQVFASRNQASDYASASGLGVGDGNNALEHLQAGGAYLDGLLYFANRKVFEVEDITWEQYKLSSLEQRTSLEAMVSLRAMGGEYYDISWQGLITGGNDEH